MKGISRFRIARWAAALLICVAAAGVLSAQAPSSAKSDPTVAEFSHKSELMGREMPYRVIVPKGYDDPKKSSARYPVLYLLHGLWGHYDNWTEKNVPGVFQREGLIIVTPEGGNGWYVDSKGEEGGAYESYFIKELVAEIDGRFRTVPERKGRFVAGLSMGGYGAIKFALKYPELFSMVGSFSGALDAPLRSQSNPNLSNPISKVFGEADSAVRSENDVFGLVRKISDERKAALPFIYMDCGTDDWLIGTNRDFSGLLVEKKIPHEFRQLPGAHAWTYWNVQVQEFIRLVEARLAQIPATKTEVSK